jgi:Sugar kinases, ribokinase family
MPGMGETIAGSGFKMGPGGKGSNQAVAAARVGAEVAFISRIGTDAFGNIALSTWEKEGIRPHLAVSDNVTCGLGPVEVIGARLALKFDPRHLHAFDREGGCIEDRLQTADA